MRRYFESRRPADRSAIDSVPDGLFLVRVERVQLARAEALLPDWLRCSRAFAFGRVLDHRPPLLHGQSDVEVELVLARFWL
jgi:hypothetical protein